MTPAAIAITGPTASGKTAAALALALAAPTPVEIISVDSALVYQGMDIGTAKPTLAERAAVPHHLIDIIGPHETYNVAQFTRDARQKVQETQGRGHWPVFVGGTMLYLKALIQGLDDMPTVDPAWRDRVAADAARLGWPALHAQLAEIDPLTAARLAPLDAQRISRALEVYRATGQTLSSLQKGQIQVAPALLNESRVISLEPADRSFLHQRIHERFEAMLAGGFWPEMQALYANPALNPVLPAMRCVGYRQAWALMAEHEAKHAPAQGEMLNFTPAEWRALTQAWTETGCAATRQLAKRQLTWLRSMPQRHVVPCDDSDAAKQVVKRALAMADDALA
jgi:tRNA dimethylallyltransferase